MNNQLLRNVIRFFVLVTIQVLILNHINFNTYINPYLYILFILLLPFETKPWLLLVSSFLLGITIDIFSGTGGIHAAASVLTAYLRPFIIRVVASKREYEPGIQPGVKDLGFNWFFLYALILTLIHHTVLFTIEVFRLDELWSIVSRVFFSTIFTMLLIIISQYLFYRPRR